MEDVMTNEELKKCLADILSDFADYCDENNLNYIIDFGTLLGAVRHKGFIPWDDDIDVSMPREDYIRLHELVKVKPLKSNYVLESLLAGNSDYPFAKIVDKNTEIVNSRSSLLHHLWIDIFPIDGISEKQAKKIDALQRKTTRYIKFTSKSARKIEWCGLKTTLIILLTHIHKTSYYGKKLDDIAQQSDLNDCQYGANIAWGSAYRYMSKTIYYDTVKLEFEGKLYNAPKEYDMALKRYYGDDYMQLPPVEQRDSHDIIARRIK